MKREEDTIELFSNILATPGQEIIVEGVLDKKFEAFLPHSFMFDDPCDWVITSFEIHRKEQLKTNLLASNMRVSLFRKGRCETLQTLMTYKLTAIAQRQGLKLHCVIIGQSIMSRYGTN